MGFVLNDDGRTLMCLNCGKNGIRALLKPVVPAYFTPGKHGPAIIEGGDLQVIGYATSEPAEPHVCDPERRAAYKKAESEWIWEQNMKRFSSD